MAASSFLDPNSFAALCDGIPTALDNQPARPSDSVLEARLNTLFGAPLPSSAAGNRFADLYNADGTQITLHSLADVSWRRLPPTTLWGPFVWY